VGQVGDPTGSSCGPNFDWIQLSVTGGNSYTVPGKGTITSWTMFGGTTTPNQQFTFKVFRKVGDPAVYQVVGHAGPQTLTPGGTAMNTFPASIAVKAGDLIGFHNVADQSECALEGVAKGTFAQSHDPGDLPDGQSAAFNVIGDAGPLNLEASFVPDNHFKLASTTRNKKRGTARLSFDLPNPGTLRAKGSGAKVSFTSTGPIGGLESPGSTPSLLLVKATGAKRRQLNATGRVKLKLVVTYTPTGGDPKTLKQKVKLLKLLG
jgi:hypothetical protein